MTSKTCVARRRAAAAVATPSMTTNRTREALRLEDAHEAAERLVAVAAQPAPSTSRILTSRCSSVRGRPRRASAARPPRRAPPARGRAEPVAHPLPIRLPARRTRAAGRPPSRTAQRADRRCGSPRPARARSARSAVRQATASAVGDARRRRPRGVVVRARLEHEHALARRGHPARRARRPPVGAARAAPAPPRQHERVDRSSRELAQPRVDVAAQLDDVEVGARARAAARGGAATTSRPARRRQRSATPRRTARRADRRARGAPTSASPSAAPGTSLAECTARSISPRAARARAPPPTRLVVDRAARGRPDVATVTSSTSPPSSDRPPAAPGPAPARCPASPSHHGGRGAAGGRCRAARRPRPAPARRRRARTARARAAAARGACPRPRAQPDRRLVQQPVHHRPRHRLDAREVARRRALPAPRVLGQHLLDDLRRRARAARRSSAARRAGPSHSREALDLLLDDLLGARAPRPRGPTRCARTTACRSSMSRSVTPSQLAARRRRCRAARRCR